MTVKEIITALRCMSSAGEKDCSGCKYRVLEPIPEGLFSPSVTADAATPPSSEGGVWESCDCDRAALDAADMLERMVWITVKERLPEPGKRVLATDGVFVGEAYKTTAGTWWRHAGMPWRTVLDGRVVTHWMELPEAPGDV